ncbi:MAG: RNA recognition motif-containing protein [Polyangiales bacterium]|jgi:RNA recognition motif-containing protein
MSRGDYGLGKRQRENEKARKKKEKLRRRADNKSRGGSEPEYVSAEEITGDLPSIEQAMANLEKRKSADRSAGTIPCKLFVGSLSRRTTTETLRAAFEEFGPVSDAIVITHRDTGESRGFGFVTMASRRDATKAIEQMHDADLEGRNIVVNIATER